MDRFVTRENIKRYRRLAGKSTDPAERSRIMTLLAEEEGKATADVSRQGDAPRKTIPRQCGDRESGRAWWRRAAQWQLAARLRTRLPIGCSPCCRRADYERLRPHLEHMALKYRQSLYRANRPIGFVYFIETGVGSLVNTMANGDAAEVGTIGNEGVVGLPLVLRRRHGRPPASTSRCRAPACA